MATPYLLGKDATLHLADAPFEDVDADEVEEATLTEVAKVKDVTVSLSKTEFDTTTRAENFATNGVAQTIVELGFQLQIKTGDASYEALRDAFLDGDEIGAVAVDTDIDVDGAQGPAGNFTVTGFTHQQPIAGEVVVDVVLKPSSMMQWYVYVEA